MAYRVGKRGQVVISKDIRERLGIKPGWLALQRLVGDRVEIHFLPPEHRRSLKGAMARHLKANVGAGGKWTQARKAAWEQAAAEEVNRESEP